MSRIYLVEDHTIVRDGLRAVLTGAGHEVVGECAGAVQALPAIAALVPDVLLLDMNLATESGLDLLAALQQRSIPVRTLMLTMAAQPHGVAESLRLGALGYVLKDISTPELLRAVEAVARGQRHLGPGVADLMMEGLVAAPPENPLSQLSPRERQVVRLVVLGNTSAAIAEQMHLSPKTVETYRSRLMAKLGVCDVPALVRLAVRTGLVDAAER